MVSAPNLGRYFQNKNLEGTFVLFHPKRSKLIVYNPKRATTRFLPASTFKVPNALIALDSGAVKDIEEVIPYGGAKEYFKNWEQDMTLPQAVKTSNVAVFHTIAKRIGLETYRDKLSAFDYGNANPGDSIDNRFWLNGPIKISPLEQVMFFRKLVAGEFPISDHSFQLVRSMIKIEETNGYTIFAKSGWAGPEDPQTGWWVGWVEKDGLNYPFALNILINTNQDAKQRAIIAKACIQEYLSEG